MQFEEVKGEIEVTTRKLSLQSKHGCVEAADARRLSELASKILAQSSDPYTCEKASALKSWSAYLTSPKEIKARGLDKVMDDTYHFAYLVIHYGKL